MINYSLYSKLSQQQKHEDKSVSEGKKEQKKDSFQLFIKI